MGSGIFIVLKYSMDNKNRPEKEAVNIVHQNAIWRETIKKEQRTASLHNKSELTLNFNPYHKMHTVATKPNSKSNEQAVEDSAFLKLIDGAMKEPYLKNMTVPLQKRKKLDG